MGAYTVHKNYTSKSTWQPASEKQIVLLTSLRKERTMPQQFAEMTGEALAEGVVSKAQASQWITDLFKMPKVGKTQEFPPGAPVPAMLPETKEGYYVRDGEVFKVVISKSSGKPYAKKMVVKNAGTKNASGTWEYAPGIVKQLATLTVLTAQEAGVIGKKVGACMICGRTLTKHESIEAGIGPICAGKL